MNLAKTLLSLAAGLLLATTATAQLVLRPTTMTQRVGQSFDRSLGNSWLGGGVHAHMWLSRSWSTISTNQSASLDSQLRAYVNLLNDSTDVVTVDADLANATTAVSQTRSGQFRVQLLGFDVINRSFASNTNDGSRNWTFNAFPVAPRADVGVGPFTLTLTGNFGAGLSTQANFYLPAAVPQLSAYASFNAYGTATATVAIGVPYVLSFGARIEGRVLDSTLTLFGGVNASGFFGTATFEVTAITLRLYAFISTIVHTWTTHLTTWSAGNYTANLF